MRVCLTRPSFYLQHAKNAEMNQAVDVFANPELHRLEDELAEAKLDLRSVRQQIEDAEKDAAHAHDQANHLEKENRHLQSMLESHKLEKEDVETRAKAVESGHEEDVVRKLQKTVSHHKMRVAELEMAVEAPKLSRMPPPEPAFHDDETAQQLRKAQSDVKTLKAQVSSLITQLQDAGAEVVVGGVLRPAFLHF
jgi:chromosome segregation ATPase